MLKQTLLALACCAAAFSATEAQTIEQAAPQAALEHRLARIAPQVAGDYLQPLVNAPVTQELPPVENTQLPEGAFFPCAEINNIGGHYYDLQSNRSIGNRIVSAGSGALVAWTGSIEESPYADRGSYVRWGGLDAWYGNSYGPRVENVRTGWPAVVSCTDMEQVLISHVVDSVPGTNLYLAFRNAVEEEWQHSFVPSGLGADKVWPRAVSGGLDGNTIHVVAHLAGTHSGQETPLVYARSTDAGATWDIVDHLFAELDSTALDRFSPEAYALHARGEKVVLAVFGLVADSFVLVSEDNGATWVKHRIFDFPVEGYMPNDLLPENPEVAYDYNGDGVSQEYLSTDGSGAVHIDASGTVHVAYGSMYYMDADTADGWYSSFPTTNGMHYWNSTMPEDSYELIAYAPDLNGDGVMNLDSLPNGNYNVSCAAMPSFASDGADGIFLTYSSPVEGAVGADGMNRRHQFLVHSSDGGESWSTESPVDLTPDGGEQMLDYNFSLGEYSFGCLNPDASNGSLQLLVQRDWYAGTLLQANHDLTLNRSWFVEVPVEALTGTEVCIIGCSDPGACNFDVLANEEGECIYPEPGLSCGGYCLDQNACNYISDGFYGFESFDNAEVGSWVSSLPNWLPWTPESLGMLPDAQIAPNPLNTADVDFGNVLQIHTPDANGASDVVYVVGEEGGMYRVRFDLFVPEGNQAWYNFQEDEIPALGWAFEGFLNSDGTFEYVKDGESVGTGFYAQGQWLHFYHEVDMLNETIRISIDSEEVAFFSFDSPLGGVNFYSLSSQIGNAFYVDNVNVGAMASGSCDYCGAEICEDASAINFNSIGTCCYANATLPQSTDYIGSWSFINDPAAIEIGTEPGAADVYTGWVAPAQSNDRLTLHPNGAYRYETQGDVLDAYNGWVTIDLDFETAGFFITEGTGWNGTDQIQLINGSEGYGCPFIGVMDSGPVYDILELTNESLVLSAPVNDINCAPTGQFFTLHFERDENFSPNSEGICDWGCTNPESLVFDPSAIFDNGLCEVDADDYTCEDAGASVWDGIPLGMTPSYQTGVVGLDQSWTWVFNVPGMLVEPGSGVSYAVHHVDWLELSGVPAWAEVSAQPDVDLGASTEFCLEATGIPPAVGMHQIQVLCEAFISIFGQPFSIGQQEFEVTLEILENPDPIPGCVYPLAVNFVTYATYDDGSCLYPGCTDPAAGNFNPFANMDDGSCGDGCLTEPLPGCASDIDNNGSVNVSDLLLLLGEFGNTCE